MFLFSVKCPLFIKERHFFLTFFFFLISTLVKLNIKKKLISTLVNIKKKKKVDFFSAKASLKVNETTVVKYWIQGLGIRFSFATFFHFFLKEVIKKQNSSAMCKW